MSRFLLLLLVAAPAVAAEPAPSPRPLPNERGFPAALKAALCDHFDYLGGEPGTTRGEISDPSPQRFWFARLRAKRDGDYTFRYTVRLDPPVRNSFGDIADKAEYEVRVAVAKPGTKRVYQPQWFSGQTYPNAVVGDTLILPVHTDAGRTDYRFPVVRRRRLDDPEFHRDFNDREFRTIDEVPAVRVTAAPQLTLVNSWRGPGPGGREQDWYYAYLKFTTPGSYNLAPRLSHEPAGAPGRQTLAALLRRQYAVEVPSYPFRVVPAGRPVTVLLADYSQTHPYRGGGSSGWGERVSYGTQEVRVGDTVVLDCGIDVDGDEGRAVKSAVIEALPFRDVPHYTPR